MGTYSTTYQGLINYNEKLMENSLVDIDSNFVEDTKDCEFPTFEPKHKLCGLVVNILDGEFRGLQGLVIDVYSETGYLHVLVNSDIKDIHMSLCKVVENKTKKAA